MKALLRKDFYQILTQLKYLAVVAVLFTAIPEGRFIAFAILYAVLLTGNSLMSLDEQSRWESFALMLPYSRAAIVVEKYVIGWLCLAASLVLSAAFQLLWAALGVSVDFGRDLLPLLCLYAAMALLIQAVTTPLNFRLGMTKGLVYNILSIGLAFGIVFGVSAIASEAGLSAFLRLIGSLHVSVYPLLAAVLCAASIPLSIRGFEKRVMK